MVRLFKAGDRVQNKSGGPVMVVQRYARDYNKWIGWYESECFVECSWYDLKEGYKSTVVHQMNLMKVQLKKKIPEKQGAIRNGTGNT